MSRIETAQAAYWRAFGELPPEPWGVSDDAIAAGLERAVAAGRPIADAFDWWAALPDDADA